MFLAALTFAPIVRTIATSKATARGLELEISHIRPGWLSVHLIDAKIGLEGVAGVRATFEEIDVSVMPWLALRGVSVEGGELELEGTPDTLREAIAGWRERHRSSAGTGGGGGSGLGLRGERVNLTWRGVEPDVQPSTLRGLSFERGSERARAAFESARLESRWGALTLTDGSAELGAGEHGFSLESARVAQVLGRLVIGDDGAAEPAPPPSPEPPPPAASDADEDIEEEPIAGKPAAKPAVDQKSIADRLAPLAAQSWPKRREQLAKVRELLSARLSDKARLDISKVQLEVTHGASALNVGPAPFNVRREASVISASFLPPAEKGGKQLALNASLPLDEKPIEVTLDGGPISLQTLGVHEGDFGLLGVGTSELSVSTHIELGPTGSLVIAASGRLNGLALDQPALAAEPLRDVDLNWAGQIELDLGQRKFALENASVGLEDVRVNLAASVDASDDDVRIGLSVDLPKTSCQDMLTAAPAALLPQLAGLRLGGNFALHSRIAVDSSDPKKTEVEWEVDNRCKVLDTPEDIDPKRFREPFQHFVMEPDGRATEFTTGPTTELWVPFSEITPAMETGLVVCEDSRFFKHNGFDHKAIRDSIEDNLRAGHFVRGASTLSMQLAKNLYLGREKTLSRKFQEAAFTMLLEQKLSKEDILELYLNVVEFGPGVYGIRNAAMHYFNSQPAELSLAQAMFLASILPNPKANHFSSDGTLKPRWAKHLQYLMRVARKINRIGDDELEAGMKEQLVFGQAHPNDSSDFLFGTPIYDVNDG